MKKNILPVDHKLLNYSCSSFGGKFGLATEKDMLKCSSPGSQNAILFGSQVAAGVTSYDEVMLELDGPQSSMTDVLIRGQSCEDKDAQREHCAMAEAEAGAMRLLGPAR